MLTRLGSFFIHPANRQDKVSAITSSLLAWLVISFFLFLLSYSTYFVANGVFNTFKAWLNYLGVITMAATLLTLKYLPSIKTSLLIIGFMGFLFITVGVYDAGGIESQDLYWYAVLIVSNVLFVRNFQTIWILILSMLAIIFFYMLYTYWGMRIPLSGATQNIHYKFFNVIFITTVLSLMALLLVRGNQKLQDAVQQLKEVDIREELAIDFHDRIGNKLASIKHLAQLSKHTDNIKLQADALQQIEDFSSTVYDDFKDFLWAQKEGNSYLDELVNYLKDYIENYLKLSPIKFYVDLQPSKIPHLQIGFNYSREIIPIVKEVVTNSYKHSQASKLTLKVVVVSEQYVSFTIEDDGVGFENTPEIKGNGLYNMQKRMDRIAQSALKIDASTAGTAVRLTFLTREIEVDGSSKN